MMTNHITNTLLTYQIDLPSLWNFPACWSSLCEEIVKDLDMACEHGNLLTLECCTSWPQLAPASPRWVKQPVKTLMHPPPCFPSLCFSFLCSPPSSPPCSPSQSSPPPSHPHAPFH